jgi:hypothetical protein
MVKFRSADFPVGGARAPTPFSGPPPASSRRHRRPEGRRYHEPRPRAARAVRGSWGEHGGIKSPGDPARTGWVGSPGAVEASMNTRESAVLLLHFVPFPRLAEPVGDQGYSSSDRPATFGDQVDWRGAAANSAECRRSSVEKRRRGSRVREAIWRGAVCRGRDG